MLKAVAMRKTRQIQRCAENSAVNLEALSLTHQIKINTMIDQIVHPWLHSFGSAEVDSISLAYSFHLLPRAGQANNRRVELSKVGFECWWVVSCWITCYEKR